MNKLSSGGAKPRLTSGGEAETKLTTAVQTLLIAARIWLKPKRNLLWGAAILKGTEAETKWAIHDRLPGFHFYPLFLIRCFGNVDSLELCGGAGGDAAAHALSRSLRANGGAPRRGGRPVCHALQRL